MTNYGSIYSLVILGSRFITDFALSSSPNCKNDWQIGTLHVIHQDPRPELNFSHSRSIDLDTALKGFIYLFDGGRESGTEKPNYLPV